MKSEFIEKKEFKCMIKDIREEYKLIMLISLESGLRLSDVLPLTFGQALGWEPVTERKTGKTVVLCLPKYLKDAITGRLSNLQGSLKSSDLVFPSDADIEKPFHRSTIYRAVRKAAETAGVEQNVTPHTARKIYAVELYRATGDPLRVQKALRHDKLETTLLYALADRLQHFPD